MVIKIANIYWLLAYAWDFWADGEVVDIAALRTGDTTNLLAMLLNIGTRRAIRRGLHQDYQTQEIDLAGIRGRPLLGESERRMLLSRGYMHCAFDELNHASLANRIIKSTLERVIGAAGLDAGLQLEIGTTLRELRPIPSLRVDGDAFRRVRTSRSNTHYQLLVSICELIYLTETPSRQSGKIRFRDFCQDEVIMHALFEEFVRNFYHAHALEKGMTCLGAKKVAWDAVPSSKTPGGLLPEMRTDVSLEGPLRHMIIDCKFYPEALTGRFTLKLRSDHLYQLWTYVSQQRKVEEWRECEGLLLYPTSGVNLDLEYTVDGQRIRAATVDLGADWSAIRKHLVDLLD